LSAELFGAQLLYPNERSNGTFYRMKLFSGFYPCTELETIGVLVNRVYDGAAAADCSGNEKERQLIKYTSCY
jgi:hypothetical protein